MSIFDSLKQDSQMPVIFNTGTIYDLVTGSFYRGIDGNWYLSGGLPAAITGIHGGGNMFKSTVIDSLVAGALRIHKDAEAFDIDTEGSKNKQRVAAMIDDPLHAIGSDEDRNLLKRLTIRSGTEATVATAWEYILSIANKKKEHLSDLVKHIPLISPVTGKQLTCIIPTFIFVDSLTELGSDEEDEMLADNKSMEDKKNKTIWLVDGNKKTLFVRRLRKLAEQYGICFCCSAHIGDNKNLDSYAPPTKQLQFMKQQDRMKGVGSRFEYLTHVLSQITSAKLLLDSAKESFYGPCPAIDINELVMTIQRNKSNASGQMVNLVVSQSEGMLNSITNLHLLRANGCVGLDGGPSKPRHSCVLYPNHPFSRNTVRDQLVSDYALNRAIELTARYMYIQQNWNITKLPFDFSRTPEQLFDAITASDMQMKDVLETTEYWSYLPQERPYMSIMDLLEKVHLPGKSTTVVVDKPVAKKGNA